MRGPHHRRVPAVKLLLPPLYLSLVCGTPRTLVFSFVHHPGLVVPVLIDPLRLEGTSPFQPHFQVRPRCARGRVCGSAPEDERDFLSSRLRSFHIVQSLVVSWACSFPGTRNISILRALMDITGFLITVPDPRSALFSVMLIWICRKSRYRPGYSVRRLSGLSVCRSVDEPPAASSSPTLTASMRRSSG